MRFLRRLMLAGLLAVAAAPVPVAGTELAALVGAPATLDYTVLRGGKPIGRQTIAFSGEGDRLVVDTKVDIEIKFAFLTLYRFHLEATEEWRAGSLQRLVARSNDDGERRLIEARLEGERLLVLRNGRPSELPPDLLPATLWHPDTARQSALLDPVKGRLRTIAVADRGPEVIEIGGRKVAARRYSITGEMTREVWYGPDGMLLQMRFPAKDGSTVTVLRRS